MIIRLLDHPADGIPMLSSFLDFLDLFFIRYRGGREERLIGASDADASEMRLGDISGIYNVIWMRGLRYL